LFKVAGDQHQLIFQTGWFVESIITQTMIVHIIRTRRIPFFQSCASPLLLFSTALIMAIGGYLPYSPLASYFGMVPLPAAFWPFMLLFIILYSVLTHCVKVWYFNKFGID
jgi:Mg2+-importing ATPase